MEPGRGRCKHGEFIIRDGCPLCITERVNKASRIEAAEGEVVRADGVPITEPIVEPDIPYEDEAKLALLEVEPMAETAVVSIAPGKDKAVIGLLNEVMRIKEFADKRVVQSPEDDKDATNDLSMMAKLKQAIEEKRKEYVGPINAHLETVNDAFKMLSGPLAEADRVTRGKVTAYRSEQERIQREQEEINRKRIEAAEAEMKLRGELSESVGLVEVTEAPGLTRTEVATSGMVQNWKYEVIDFAQLPDEYKVADHAMLSAVARKHHDQKQVPGVRFYNEPTLRVSSR